MATIHQRYRQTGLDRTMVRWHRANRFTNGCPKNDLVLLCNKKASIRWQDSMPPISDGT